MFELQPGSREERVMELANTLDCPDFRIWGWGEVMIDKAKMYGLGFMVK